MGDMDLGTLSLEQLSQFKQQEENKLQTITSNYQQLKSAQARFISSRDTLSSYNPNFEGSSIMVPLTQSLYVPGLARDVKQVTVELGTGFYATKTVPEAVKFLQRKIDLVGKNADGLLQVVSMTRKNIEAIMMTMQGKMDEIREKRGAMMGSAN
ncbi:hypothetical protein TrCOL_g3919 [Triparma columacea]|uniref:Prefoldin subunit 5 n=1 Tax=Triparma columacea TaxID=722753 RepID=A0A9W7GB75_9STRA|nr:hypothetical protein TrCOL_g3919 [Triparma columacea]